METKTPGERAGGSGLLIATSLPRRSGRRGSICCNAGVFVSFSRNQYVLIYDIFKVSSQLPVALLDLRYLFLNSVRFCGPS